MPVTKKWLHLTGENPGIERRQEPKKKPGVYPRPPCCSTSVCMAGGNRFERDHGASVLGRDWAKHEKRVRPIHKGMLSFRALDQGPQRRLLARVPDMGQRDR